MGTDVQALGRCQVGNAPQRARRNRGSSAPLHRQPREPGSGTGGGRAGAAAPGSPAWTPESGAGPRGRGASPRAGLRVFENESR